MKCPIDGETLNVAERSGVEIDYCPKCRGVWLDRGELDKIIEHAAMPPAGMAPQRGSDRGHYQDDRRQPERRESFLGELFDFF